MRRREISKILFASATVSGASALSQKANAQTCTAPCYAQTAAEAAASITPANYTYPPGAIERYGNMSTSSASATANRKAIQAALNCNATVFSFYGWANAYPIDDYYLLVPPGTTAHDISIIATASTINYPAWGANHQGQIYLLNGTDAKATRLKVNGYGFNAGGVGMLNFYNNECDHCEIFNTGTSQGVLCVDSMEFKVTNNFIYYTAQGVQYTGCAGGLVAGNTIRVISGGGLFQAANTNVTTTGNAVSDCGDVGIDCEGGVDCVISGNTIKSANNGELSWFSNGLNGQIPQGCSFVGNTAYRTSTHLAWNGTSEVATASSSAAGGIQISSVTNGQRGISFEGNTVYNTFAGSWALFTNTLGQQSCGIAITGNKFYSSSGLHNVEQAWQIVVKGNLFYGTAGSEAAQNEFKSCAGGIWSENQYYYDNAKSTNYALHYYTDSATMGSNVTNPVISNNEFFNCGTLACQHEPYQTGVQAIMFGNAFSLSGAGTGSVAYSSNGGLDSTTDGYPLFRGQKLFLQTSSAALTLSTVSALQGSQSVSYGKLLVVGGNALGASYSFVYSGVGPTLTSRDGSGLGSGIPASSSRYATFSGTTIAIVAPAVAQGNIELDVTSWL